MTDPERELLILLAAATAARYQSQGLFSVSRRFAELAEQVTAQIEDAETREKYARGFNIILGRDPNV